MLIRCALLLLCLNCVRTSQDNDFGLKGHVSDFNTRFSLWPSVHNAAKLLRVLRDTQKDLPVEGGANDAVVGGNTPAPSVAQLPKVEKDDVSKVESIENKPSQLSNKTTAVIPEPTKLSNVTEKTIPTSPVLNADVKINSTEKATVKDLDLNSPGVLKRGFIVFGGFALLATAYFIFYRGKQNKSETNNMVIDANQFRYGVLQSEDKDKLELSRVPLTMESDDDEDEDLEIFDLGQKKKSLSYVNLQTNDEDIVMSRSNISEDNDRDNLLLDIEDGNSDTLINWSNNGTINKVLAEKWLQKLHKKSLHTKFSNT